MVVFSTCACCTCPAIAGGDHSGDVLDGEVLFLLGGVIVAVNAVVDVIVVSAVAVLDGIAVGELWWCLIQCALAKVCLCLSVNGFGLLLLGLPFFVLGFARFCGWKNAAWASRSRYLFAALLFGVAAGFLGCVFGLAGLTLAPGRLLGPIATCTSLGCRIALVLVLQ